MKADAQKYYCEVCDRDFNTDDKYKEHLATHRTVSLHFTDLFI